MSFSAVTCLTYTGSTPLGGIIDLYSDFDGFSSSFKTSIPLSSITGNECPYYIDNVPNGTSVIRIFDVGTGCYCDVSVNSNNLCVTCDLNFNLYSPTSIGRLVVGDLTGSCESHITDYRIYWYETSDMSNPVFISGYGSEFTPYNYTHPLTGPSSIFAPSGEYKPIIDKVKISGLTFSQSGGTGLIPAEVDCLSSQTILIEPFTCGNGDGSSDDPNYAHRVNFLSAGADSIPQSLYSDFLFTGTTNYFAWKFKGFSVEDRLRLIYYGSSYSEPLLIEDISIGSNLSTSNFDLSVFPKSASTSSDFYVKKVTCLTGITRNINDFIRMEVIPNQNNTQTNWDFYFTCLDSFDQNTCPLNNSPYKIILSSITSENGYKCNSRNFQFKISGCVKNSDDFSKYMINDEGGVILNGTSYYNSVSYLVGNNIDSLNIYNLFTNSIDCPTIYLRNEPLICSPQTSTTITFKKYISGGIGVIDFEFGDVNDFYHYYYDYLTLTSGAESFGGVCTSSSGSYTGTPYNPSDIRYYRRYQLAIPTNTGNTICGDGTSGLYYDIHTSTQVTTGYTGSIYTLRFTMPTMVNGLTYDPICNISPQIQSFVDYVNNISTGSTNNYTGTTNTGSKYTKPFYRFNILCSGSTSNQSGVASGSFSYPKYLNETIVYTGITPTIVPELTGKTFDFKYTDFSLEYIPNNLDYYFKSTFYYQINLTNPSDVRDFEIISYKPTGSTFGPPILIYSYTGVTSSHTVHDSSFFIP